MDYGDANSMATWLTLEEAAKHLKIGKSSLYQLAREGGIPAHKYGRVWRFDQEELDGWMKSSGDRAPKAEDNSE
jgi:excisionase family DNA binding protein